MTSTDRRYGVAEGLAFKAPVRVATTANITLSGLQSIDGVTVIADDRVLVWAQTTTSENGIYAASSGTWVRSVDFDGSRDVVRGTQVIAAEGTQEGTVWTVATSSPAIGSALSFRISIPSDVTTITVLKSLTGATLRDGQVIWLRDASTKGRHGAVIYDAGSSVTGDDVVYFTPSDSTGRFVRYEWYNHTEIHARWWGLTLSTAATDVANGTALTALFTWIQAQTASGTCVFPNGQLYVELTTGLTLTKKRGWKFKGTSPGGDANSIGTIFNLQGGGATEFVKYLSCLNIVWERCRFRVEGTGFQTIFNVGASNYYDTDGVTLLDATAISSYLCQWNLCDFYVAYTGGYTLSRAAIHLHSAVTNTFNSCWFSGLDTAFFLGETGTAAGDADGRTLAKGACAQLTINDCLMDGEIQVRKLSGLTINGGQLTRPSGPTSPTRGARIAANTLTWAMNITLNGVDCGYGGDFSNSLISASMVILGLTVTNSCYIGGYNTVAVADSTSTNWDVSPRLSDATSMTYVLDIKSTCTGKNIGSRSDYVSPLTAVITDARTIQDYRPLFKKGSKTHDFGSLADGVGETTTVTVTGAALGDPASASLSVDLQGMTMTAWVSATNTVSVRLQNETTGTLDLASATLAAFVFKREI